MKKRILLLILTLAIFIMPLNIFAYSNRIVIGGETIGIEVQSNGIYVVGFYEVDNKLIGKDNGFLIGDIIKNINGIDVYDINSLNDIISDEGNYKFKIERNNKLIELDVKLLINDSKVKTGLYVKDRINGIGTLSYIDPETKIYGSLGHEIIESNSKKQFLLKSGNIYKAEVVSIKKSSDGLVGEKNAEIDRNNLTGTIDSNREMGIFGFYNDNFTGREMLDVGKKEEIKKGDATIRTVLSDNKLEDFKIKIISIDEASKNKNILFEIIDKRLLEKTGGIVQGMSGSPIIQNNKIIGVVNYVVIDDVEKGYGVFITTMLEEGDKILS